MKKNDTLLIYAPVPLYRDNNGELLIEQQAVNGLRLWAKNFTSVIVMMPLSCDPPPKGWIQMSVVEGELDRVRIEPLPMSYRPDQFIKTFFNTKRRIAELIIESQFLSFAIGGLFGDWGAVACHVAHRMKRPYAVWTDRVESEVTRQAATVGPFKKRLKARLTYKPMALLERLVIRRSSLGLFHGRETYETYAPYMHGPKEVVHDIHLAPTDHIDITSLKNKAKQVAGGQLRLLYVGRADPMKGPFDWIEVLRSLSKQGVRFQARWLGDGSERDEMLVRITQAGLQSCVDMPGFINDRQLILEEMRAAHIFMFCHLSPESPRCLIEALASGCPIVGYDSAYPRDLISKNSGGSLVCRGDTAGLAKAIKSLNDNREKLSNLFIAAALDGKPFTDEAVFKHRSEIIKFNLS